MKSDLLLFRAPFLHPRIELVYQGPLCNQRAGHLLRLLARGWLGGGCDGWVVGGVVGGGWDGGWCCQVQVRQPLFWTISRYLMWPLKWAPEVM